MELLLRPLANTDAHAEPLAVVMELHTGRYHRTATLADFLPGWIGYAHRFVGARKAAYGRRGLNRHR
jgi:hypothetical protein